MTMYTNKITYNTISQLRYRYGYTHIKTYISRHNNKSYYANKSILLYIKYATYDNFVVAIQKYILKRRPIFGSIIILPRAYINIYRHAVTQIKHCI